MRPSSRGLFSLGQSPAEEDLAGIAFDLEEVRSTAVVVDHSRRHICEGKEKVSGSGWQNSQSGCCERGKRPRRECKVMRWDTCSVILRALFERVVERSRKSTSTSKIEGIVSTYVCWGYCGPP